MFFEFDPFQIHQNDGRAKIFTVYSIWDLPYATSTQNFQSVHNQKMLHETMEDTEREECWQSIYHKQVFASS